MFARLREDISSVLERDPAAPRKLMARLHRLALRAELEVEEVHILRGIARAISGRCR